MVGTSSRADCGTRRWGTGAIGIYVDSRPEPMADDATTPAKRPAVGGPVAPGALANAPAGTVAEAPTPAASVPPPKVEGHPAPLAEPPGAFAPAPAPPPVAARIAGRDRGAPPIRGAYRRGLGSDVLARRAEGFFWRERQGPSALDVATGKELFRYEGDTNRPQAGPRRRPSPDLGRGDRTLNALGRRER